MKNKTSQWMIVIAVATLTLGSVPSHASKHGKPNSFWWPNLINLQPLRQHIKTSSPMGSDFDYIKEFKTLDIAALKKDIDAVLTTSQDWWPADYGNYGPFFIRMAWHSAGTYRVVDGRGGASGGQLRFEPLNSWPDNGNLDKARRLLWPIKKKYGKKISWADLMVLTGNVSLENMGFKTFGFAGGRQDDWEPDLVYWGPEKKMLASKRRNKKGKLKGPMAAVKMGLIYVNPEGPNGVPDPKASARSIRESFGRMAMNDEETVALIAGGHTFGKAHGAHKSKCVSKEPAAGKLEDQNLGWKNKCKTGKGADTVTSGLEGAWTSTPTQWSMQYLANLFAFKWVKTKSPAGALQWIPAKGQASKMVPDAHIKGKRHAPIMFTADLALRFDPVYKKISQKFLTNPKAFEEAFAKAWFKLTHRDMGPRARYVGADVPSEVLNWQDPIPKRDYKLIGSGDIRSLKKKIAKSGLSRSELISTAWASAASYRDSDMRGGTNGGRLNLQPQNSWKANSPKQLKRVLTVYSEIKADFDSKRKKVSMADLIVLGGVVGLESAIKEAGHKVKVPFSAGRVDATQEQTDVKSFSYLEVKADAFRNYYDKGHYLSPVTAMIDKANQLSLTVPEMAVLLGGMRALNINHDQSKVGVLTSKPGVLTNDFFVNLLDMSVEWTKSKADGVYEAKLRKDGSLKWKASPVDLAIGSSSELRAIAEVYAADDGKNKFAQDFVNAWSKVMNLGRFM